MPIWVKPGFKIFLRCPSEFISPLCAFVTLLDLAIFSPADLKVIPSLIKVKYGKDYNRF